MNNPIAVIRDWAIAFLLAGALILAPAALRAQEASDADRVAVQQTIGDQIAAFRAGDHDRAYSFAAASIKDTFRTVDAFIAMVRSGYMPLYAPQSYSFGRSAAIGEAIHQEVFATDSGGRQWQAVYTLRRDENGAFKIIGVKLNPWNGASA
jgi:hypothetical protein